MRKTKRAETEQGERKDKKSWVGFGLEPAAVYTTRDAEALTDLAASFCFTLLRPGLLLK